MRKLLLSVVALTGIAVASQFAGAGVAQAQTAVVAPAVFAPAAEPGLIQQVQYYGGWRHHDRYERERFRRHEEWRHRHWGYRHHY